MFPNASGAIAIIGMDDVDADNPFFQELGTNGRSCVTCHRPAQGWNITPAELRDRFDRTDGLDPIFRTNDGSNCEGADVSTIWKRRRAFSLLLSKGLIRTALDLPAGAEFEILNADDPYRCGAPLTSASMYRRPLPTANLKFLSAVMWDGRQSKPGQAIRDGLISQVVDAVTRHAQGPPPPPAQVQSIVDFELGLFSTQVVDRSAGSLAAGVARSGPDSLGRELFCIGINDPLDLRPSMPGACAGSSGGLNPFVFTLFRGWTDADSPRRQAIARGEAIFNTRQFVIDNVPGLNGRPDDPVRRPILNGTCTICHDTPNAGNHSVPMALNIGVADAVAAHGRPAALHAATSGDGRDGPDHRSRTGDGDRQVGRYRQVQGARASRPGRAAAVFPRRLRGDAGGCDQVLRHAVPGPIHRTGEGGSHRVPAGTLKGRKIYLCWAGTTVHHAEARDARSGLSCVQPEPHHIFGLARHDERLRATARPCWYS